MNMVKKLFLCRAWLAATAIMFCGSAFAKDWTYDPSANSVPLGSDVKNVVKGDTYTWDFSAVIPFGKKVVSVKLVPVGIGENLSNKE